MTQISQKIFIFVFTSHRIICTVHNSTLVSHVTQRSGLSTLKKCKHTATTIQMTNRLYHDSQWLSNSENKSH